MGPGSTCFPCRGSKLASIQLGSQQGGINHLYVVVTKKDAKLWQ